MTATPFPTWFANSMIVAAASTAISVSLAALAAYALARLEVPRGAGVLTAFLMITYLLPGTLTFIPLYQTLTNLGLINTYGALIATYPTFLVPFATWVMLGFFRSIPAELEEAAMKRLMAPPGSMPFGGSCCRWPPRRCCRSRCLPSAIT